MASRPPIHDGHRTRAAAFDGLRRVSGGGRSERAPRVVAELGRPETADETAARKAENRRLHRVRQTNRNLIYSLLVCLGVVVVIVALVPRGTGPAATATDYRQLAAQAQHSVSQPLLAPAVPAGWTANAAELRVSDRVTSWYVGFVTPTNGYVGYNEGLRANDTWLSDLLNGARSDSVTTIGGRPWRVYDQRAQGQSAGNAQYALATRIGATYLVAYGTASPQSIRSLAAGLATDADTAGITGTAVAPGGPTD